MVYVVVVDAATVTVLCVHLPFQLLLSYNVDVTCKRVFVYRQPNFGPGV